MCTEEWLLAVSAIFGFCNTSAEDLQDSCSLYAEGLVHRVQNIKNGKIIVDFSADL